jgi:hypothetical protein
MKGPENVPFARTCKQARSAHGAGQAHTRASVGGAGSDGSERTGMADHGLQRVNGLGLVRGDGLAGGQASGEVGLAFGAEPLNKYVTI